MEVAPTSQGITKPIETVLVPAILEAWNPKMQSGSCLFEPQVSMRQQLSAPQLELGRGRFEHYLLLRHSFRQPLHPIRDANPGAGRRRRCRVSSVLLPSSQPLFASQPRLVAAVKERRPWYSSSDSRACFAGPSARRRSKSLRFPTGRSCQRSRSRWSNSRWY